ncbi:MAG: M24 family metallopeptidase, partial [Desulfobacterales bacterium]|nr:M24 family metallopeptidase [Desulfobacterales bacterium]
MKQKKKAGKIGRNQLCPCGSNRKYKNCCMERPGAKAEPVESVYRRKYNIRLKTAEDIAQIRKAGELVMATFREVEAILAPGITTEAINTLVHEFTLQHKAQPAPLNYRGFPKSVCVSVNEVICHGIPGERVLNAGDIVNVDITSILDGFYADANKTYFIGTPGPEARKIVDVARNSLKAGLTMVKPGHTVGDIGWA